jgi:hypothetical protein
MGGHHDGDQLERRARPGAAGNQEVEVGVADAADRIALDQGRIGGQTDGNAAGARRWCGLEQQRQQEHGIGSEAGMGKPSCAPARDKEPRAGILLSQPHPLYQLLEPRVASEKIVGRVHLEAHHLA